MRVAAALVVLLFGGQALADDAPELVQGSRLRIRASSLNGPIRGTLASLSGDSLTLETQGRAPLVLERSQITRLEVSAGRRSRGRGAAIGALIGLGVGLLSTTAIGLGTCSGDNAGSEDCVIGTVAGLVVLTPALTILGAGIGVALPPGERWVKVPPQGMPAGGSPPLGLRLVVKF